MPRVACLTPGAQGAEISLGRCGDGDGHTTRGSKLFDRLPETLWA